MLPAQRDWQYKYTPEDGDLVRLFYILVLEDAIRYDRLTGYFNANALALAARGIEELIRHHGQMRLIVGCTLAPAEIAAIERGEQLKTLVEQRLTAQPLTPPDAASRDALELLAWMVAHGILEVKVAVPRDAQRRPLPADGIFHEKAGIIEDRAGDRLLRAHLDTVRSNAQTAPLAGLEEDTPDDETADEINNSLGGVFYVLFWCLLVFWLLPRVKPWRIALAVLAVTCLLELLQLWHPPFLEWPRSFWIGQILLGTTFAWSDFPYYFIGAGLGWLWMQRFRPALADC